MSMIHIYDNFIPEINLKSLSDILTFKMPWYFSVDGKFDISTQQSLSLGCVKNREEFGSVENYLLEILNQKGIDTSLICRSICNCFRRLDKPEYHQDPGKTSYMFYLNSEWKRQWGAPTKFKSKKYHISRKVIPKPGRLVIFDAKLWHKGTAPNFLMPSYMPGRFSIVLQER